MKAALLLVACALVSATHDNGKISNRWSPAVSGDGWFLLGKYCFGYSSSATGEGSVGGQQQIGNIDLMVRSTQNYENLTVLIYDDEPGSWGTAGKAEIPCADRYQYAKDFTRRKAFKVNTEGDGLWIMHQTPLYEHLRPREWYVVLARCDNAKPDDRHFDVEVDLHWTDEGVYDNGMGPNQCVDNGVIVSGTRVALGVFIGIFALITFVLALYVRAQRKNLKANRGARVDQSDEAH
jgi:hypothetical protein